MIIEHAIMSDEYQKEAIARDKRMTKEARQSAAKPDAGSMYGKGIANFPNWTSFPCRVASVKAGDLVIEPDSDLIWAEHKDAVKYVFALMDEVTDQRKWRFTMDLVFGDGSRRMDAPSGYADESDDV